MKACIKLIVFLLIYILTFTKSLIYQLRIMITILLLLVMLLMAMRIFSATSMVISISTTINTHTHTQPLKRTSRNFHQQPVEFSAFTSFLNIPLKHFLRITQVSKFEFVLFFFLL